MKVEHVRLNRSFRYPVAVGLVDHVKSDQEPTWDVHYELELGLVLSGRMRRLYSKEQQELGRGSLWFCGMWEPHGWQVVEPGRALVMTLWPPAVAETHYPEAPDMHWLRPFLASPKPKVSINDSEFLSALEVWSRDADPATVKGRVRLRLLSQEILTHVPEVWSSTETECPRGPAPAFQLSPAIEMALLSTHRIDTTRAASACGISRSHFARRFREVMGVSFGQFGLQHRLREAAAELIGSDKPLKKIACDWDFTDASHFLKSFERFFGCTPGTYRRRSVSQPGKDSVDCQSTRTDTVTCEPRGPAQCPSSGKHVPKVLDEPTPNPHT